MLGVTLAGLAVVAVSFSFPATMHDELASAVTRHAKDPTRENAITLERARDRRRQLQAEWLVLGGSVAFALAMLASWLLLNPSDEAPLGGLRAGRADTTGERGGPRHGRA